MMELARSQVKLAKSQSQFVNGTKTALSNQSAQIRNIEVQLGKMVSRMNERQQGSLPSTSEINLKR